MAVKKNTETPQTTEPVEVEPVDAEPDVSQDPAPAAKRIREAIPEVPFEAVVIDAFQPRTTTRSGAGRPRSEYMVKLGKLLQKHFSDKTPCALECDADEKTVGALERKISAAAQFEKLGLRFGSYVKSKNPGKVYVTFIVVEQTKRPRKPKTEETAGE